MGDKVDMGSDEQKSIKIEVSGGTIGQLNLGQDQSTIIATNNIKKESL